MRRTLWVFGLVAALAFATAALDTWAGPGCGKCGRGGGGGCGMGSGAQAKGGPHGGKCAGECGGNCGTGGGSASMAEARDTFHALLGDHDKIHRAVEQIEGGVATTTVSDDPTVAATIRLHVRQMQERVEAGQGLRHWDPLFVEVFKHHDEIVMTIEDVPGGVLVRETSQNPDVVKLIRAHAKAVTEFSERGFERAHEASPLPEGYAAPELDSTN